MPRGQILERSRGESRVRRRGRSPEYGRLLSGLAPLAAAAYWVAALHLPWPYAGDLRWAYGAKSLMGNGVRAHIVTGAYVLVSLTPLGIAGLVSWVRSIGAWETSGSR